MNSSKGKKMEGLRLANSAFFLAWMDKGLKKLARGLLKI